MVQNVKDLFMSLSGAGTCTNAPGGYQWKHNNVYYKKHNSNNEYIKAILTCQGEGATLAMVKTQDALTAITSFMSTLNICYIKF